MGRIAFAAAALCVGAQAFAAEPGDRGMAIMSAVGTSNGGVRLVRGEGAVSATAATDVGGGASVEVTFERDVRACVYVGSAAAIEPGASAWPSRFVTAVSRGDLKPNAVLVRTYGGYNASDPSSFLYPGPFHLIVYCAR